VGVAVREESLRSLRVKKNGAERQVKLVRKRAREFTQRGHAREVCHLAALTGRLQFCPLPFADINNRGQHEQPFGRVNWVETDFDRNLAAVFASAKEFVAVAHRPPPYVPKSTA